MTAQIIYFDKKEPCCSFCKKPKSKVKTLITSKNEAYICNVCLEKINILIKEQE